MIQYKKTSNAKNKVTYVALVLDESGSMSSVQESTISTTNELLQEYKKYLSDKYGKIFLSLVKFSSEVEEVFFNAPPEDLKGELDTEQYSPSGGTALYDAVGYTLSKLQRFDVKGDVGFLVIIISDGAENSSRKWNNKSIASLIKELKSTDRWTFQYIGCDEVALKEAINVGLHVTTFKNTSRGWTDLSGRLRTSNASYMDLRSQGSTSVDKLME